jgi:hypothetical protein
VNLARPNPRRFFGILVDWFLNRRKQGEQSQQSNMNSVSSAFSCSNNFPACLLSADDDSYQPSQILVVAEVASDSDVRIAVFRFQCGKNFTVSSKFRFVVAA